MKLKLTFSYNGAAFLGSATQPHQNSVQDALSKALSHLGIYSLPNFASRTDKGVHALGAVASIECGEHFKNLIYLKNQLNKFAAPNIFIKKIEFVNDDFNPRFDAKMREYKYLFCHKNFSPFLANFVSFYPRFDVNLARKLLLDFKGEHDFSFFCKNNESKNKVREIFLADAFSRGDFSVFKFRANSFLRGQIRLIIASVLAVLQGKLSHKELREQISNKKCHFRTLAPPNGLYLSKIWY